MMFQPLTFLEEIILAQNSQIGYKDGNTYYYLLPYIKPTYILMKRVNKKKKAEILKMRMIKMQIKITGDFKILK